MVNNNSVQNNSGFTLIELMATIGVAGILMGIAIPNFLSTLPGLRLNDAARQVAMDLQQIRTKAIAKNTPYQISFASSTYILRKCNDSSCASYNDDSGSLTLPPGITILTPPTAQFQPRGTAAALTTIKLTNGSSSKWVCVRTVGRVNIQDTICS